MAKKSAQKQQSFLTRLWNSKLFLPCLICGVLLILIFLLFIGMRSGDSLNNTYKKLSIPNAWTLKSTKEIPGKSPVGCAAYPDLTCPSNTYTYTATSQTDANNGIVSLKSVLVKLGFSIDGTCFRDSCQGYVLQAHKDNVAVRASAQENKEYYAIYLTIEKN